MGIRIKDIADPKLRRAIIEQDARQNAKQLNHENRDPIRSLEADQPQPVPAQALDGRKTARRQREGRVGIVVILTACVHRELDSDAIPGACKWLRDSIAASIGLDDGDARIRFYYGQVVTPGTEGVLVKIEAL